MEISFSELWRIFVAVRDAYAESVGASGVQRDVSFRTILRYAISNRTSLPAAMDMFNCVTQGSVQNYTTDEPKGIRSKNYYEQV